MVSWSVKNKEKLVHDSNRKALRRACSDHCPQHRVDSSQQRSTATSFNSGAEIFRTGTVGLN